MGSGVFSAKMEKSKAFADAYKNRWGVPVEAGHGISPAYESVYLLAEAIERAGSVEADAIVAELEKTDRAGVMGQIKFDEGHQVIYDMDPAKAAVAAVLQWNNDGSRTIVFPPAIAEGEIKLPAGLKSAK